MALMAEAVHRHGSLAAIELVHNGLDANNLYSRAASLAPTSMCTLGGSGFEPVQSRRMDKEDIRNVRRWHRAAALRAKRAGFDIIYCHAAHALTLPMQFIMRRINDRSDEYGGSLENRVRFLRELIEDTHEAVGDTCAVAVRHLGILKRRMSSPRLSSAGIWQRIILMSQRTWMKPPSESSAWTYPE
jgi:dimethylamine/trimethylamine dehydrogenase